MNPASLPWAVLFPLALLVLLPVLGRGRSGGRMLLPLAPLPALWAAWAAPTNALVSWPSFLLGSHWQLDPIGRVFLAFTAVAWTLASVYAIGYLSKEPGRRDFTASYLLAMTGNFCLIVAADAVTFLGGFALMGFAAWALVVHDRKKASLRAGAWYLALVVLGELMIFPGFVQGIAGADSLLFEDLRPWYAEQAGLWTLLLLLFGFGVKAGIAPLHLWLPLAHPAAPTPASAVLSGCMIKAGLLGWLRFLPLGERALPELAGVAGVAGAVSVIAALAIGLTQTHPKALLAYSSISKSGTLLLILVPALYDPSLTEACVTAVLLYAVFHGLHKTALFLGVGVTPSLQRPAAKIFGWLLLVTLAASFAALPGLAGSWVKLSMKPLFQADAFPGAHLFPPFWFLASLLTTLLSARFILLTRPGIDPEHRSGRLTALTWAAACGIALIFPLGLASLGFGSTSPADLWELKLLLKGWFPHGLALGLIGGWLALRWRLLTHIPPGDLAHLFRWPTPRLRPDAPSPEVRLTPPRRRLDALARRVEGLEETLNRGLGGLLFLGLILGLLLLVWLSP